MSITEKFLHRAEKVNSLVCVGLDSELDKIPAKFFREEYPQFAFNQWIIDQTHDLTAAYKPNVAFYEAQGTTGWLELKLTIEYLRRNHPEIVTILDAKRADIGNTNNGYVEAYFDQLGVDAVTLHPYLGREALQPFLDRTDKASIILCKTSNPGGGELQDQLLMGDGDQPQTMWQLVARLVAEKWNTNQNCMLVVGATYPEQLAQVRQIAPEMVFLVPGIGAQGGAVEDLKGGLTAQKSGLIINSSRGVIFAADPRLATQKLQAEINQMRSK